jgi:hypothetical protein
MSEFSSRLLSATNINVSGTVTGAKGIKVPSVTTANRPSGMTGSHAGALIYDQDIESLVVWSGSAWVAVGRAVDVLPTWSDSTIPTTGLKNGLIGWNTDLNEIQIYFDPGEPGDNEDEVEAGWITPFGGGEGGQLFEFSSFTFKSIVSRGSRNGPNSGQMTSEYSGEAFNDGTNFSQGSYQGYQLWTVPADGNYQIEAGGARGGRDMSYGYTDYWGAKITGTFSLTKGDQLEMVVGVGGGQYYSPHGNETGGGGGSFVKNSTNNTLLLVAGGAGGSPSNNWGWGCSRPSGHAQGQSGEIGGRYGCYYDASQASAGYGGNTSGNYHGGGGGGYLSGGQNGGGHCCTAYGGQGYNTGMVGGTGNCCYGGSGSGYGWNYGGFGGGGGGQLSGPGAGGGYTGGHTSGQWSSGSTGGGGGGSYNSGTNTTNQAGGNTSNTANTYTGDGYIKITAQ